MKRAKDKPLEWTTDELLSVTVKLKRSSSQRGTSYQVEIGDGDTGVYITDSTPAGALRSALAQLIAKAEPDPVSALARHIKNDLLKEESWR